MKLTDKRFWIIILTVGLITLLYRLVFYRHYIKYEEIKSEINSVDRSKYGFYPYGFVLIHNEGQLEYYKSCLDSWIGNAFDNFDFENFSYLITFGNPINRLSYSWYDTFRYDYSPSYTKLWKDKHQLLIVDYRDFTYRDSSIKDNTFRGNDSIYLYRLPRLPFLRGLQGL